MTKTILHNTAFWILTSYGNGEAYSLENKKDKTMYVYVQGDDATEFREIYEDMQKIDKNLDINDFLNDLYFYYD